MQQIVLYLIYFSKITWIKTLQFTLLPNKKRFSLYYCFDDNGDSHEGKTESPFFCLVTFYIEIPEYFCWAINFVELLFTSKKWRSQDNVTELEFNMPCLNLAHFLQTCYPFVAADSHII